MEDFSDHSAETMTAERSLQLLHCSRWSCSLPIRWGKNKRSPLQAVYLRGDSGEARKISRARVKGDGWFGISVLISQRERWWNVLAFDTNKRLCSSGSLTPPQPWHDLCCLCEGEGRWIKHCRWWIYLSRGGGWAPDLWPLDWMSAGTFLLSFILMAI